MESKLMRLVPALFVALLGGTFALAAGEAAPPEQQAPASALDQQVNAIVSRVEAKIRAGKPSASDLDAEIEAFDKFVAAHRTDAAEVAARALLMKAMLYIEVLEDFDRGAEALGTIRTEFASSTAARHASVILPQIEEQKEGLRVRRTLQPGTAFPDFAEKDLGGAPLSIGRYKGKIVLVDFWATWCGPCVAELPNVMAAYERYHDKGFEIVGISLDESEEKLKAFVAAKKMPWPQYCDGQGWSSKLGRRYGVNSIPATYLLDRDGVILAKDLRGAELAVRLRKIFEK